MKTSLQSPDKLRSHRYNLSNQEIIDLNCSTKISSEQFFTDLIDTSFQK